MRKFITSFFLCCICFTGISQDRYFARTYNSNVLPKGSIDLEFWHTSRFGHAGQFFHAQDQRLEVEVGLGKGLQTAFYFNRYQSRYSVTDDGTVVSNEIGFSNEWKWKTSKPSANKIGCALYFEWGVKGGDELELETKIILDKNIGKSLVAFNGVVEFEKEFEWEGGKLKSDEAETPVEFDLAYMYNLNYKIGLGFEFVNTNDVHDGWNNSVLFGGPTFNYRGDKWFVIANYLPQWGNLHKSDEFPESKVLDTHERSEARILVGISI
jgi:hypothetical protein